MSFRDDAQIRSQLEAIGPARVRHLLSQQLLVHHLVKPAFDWLAELDAEEAANAARPRQ
jgi:hypothetical protein